MPVLSCVEGSPQHSFYSFYAEQRASDAQQTRRFQPAAGRRLLPRTPPTPRMHIVEDDLGVDLSEVLSVVNTAEVFVVMFQLFERRLLVDSRTAAAEPPLIRVVDRVRSSDERFRELLRLRPRFGAPERIVAFQWPRSIRTLIECGVWDAIQQRLLSLGAAESTLLAVLSELKWEERSEELKAVRGEEPYRTLRGSSLS